MNTILFDPESITQQLLPLTYTRPVGDLRVGILTIREKWEAVLNTVVSFHTRDYLADKFKTVLEEENIWIAGNILPNAALVEAIQNLSTGSKLVADGATIAVKISRVSSLTDDLSEVPFLEDCLKINHPWDIFKLNGAALEDDFKLLTTGKTSAVINNINTVMGESIFVEQGAQINGAILNANKGPIYIGRDAEIMEGSVVRGPFAMCNNAVLKLSAKIYGPTTLGPYVKVGGEVNNSVFQGYSNKGHDGFLGNSVIGEWCNLGADTNTSNLKNNYGTVKAWSYLTDKLESTGEQFCGLVMGDHSKTGINTMLNTGTVVGVSANIYGAGFPEKFIPSFSWGGAEGFTDFRLDKAFEVAERMCSRRNVPFSEVDQQIMKHIFDSSSKYRS